MRNFLLLLCLFIISVESKSQIGYCEFPENSKIENWKNLEYISGNGTIINLGLKQGTYLIHWKFQVDSIFWKSQKVLHIANPIIDDVEVYQITPDSIFHKSSGEKIPLNLREYNISGNAIDIHKTTDNIVEFYLKVKS